MCRPYIVLTLSKPCHPRQKKIKYIIPPIIIMSAQILHATYILNIYSINFLAGLGNVFILFRRNRIVASPFYLIIDHFNLLLVEVVGIEPTSRMHIVYIIRQSTLFISPNNVVLNDREWSLHSATANYTIFQKIVITCVENKVYSYLFKIVTKITRIYN